MELFYDTFLKSCCLAYKNIVLEIRRCTMVESKRTADIVKCAQVVSPLYICGGIIGRNHNQQRCHSSGICLCRLILQIHPFQAHHNVQKQKGKIGSLPREKRNCFHTILSLHHIILLFQDICKKKSGSSLNHRRLRFFVFHNTETLSLINLRFYYKCYPYIMAAFILVRYANRFVSLILIK